MLLNRSFFSCTAVTLALFSSPIESHECTIAYGKYTSKYHFVSLCVLIVGNSAPGALSRALAHLIGITGRDGESKLNIIRRFFPLSKYMLSVARTRFPILEPYLLITYRLKKRKL